MTVGDVTTTTANISWSPPTTFNPSNIIRYDIELSEEQFGLATIEVNTLGTSVIVTGLEEYNTYQCKVAAVSSSQVGESSSPVTFTTLEAGKVWHYL